MTTRDLEARLERLDDYRRGRGEDPDAYEEELFARAAEGTADELVLADTISAGLRELAARGTIEPWVTAAEAARLRARYGERAVTIDVPPGPEATISIPADAEIVLARIPVDLRDVERLDIEVATTDGRPLKTMEDLRFDRGDGAVFTCCEGDLARRTAVGPVRSILWATRAGKREALFEIVTTTVVV